MMDTDDALPIGLKMLRAFSLFVSVLFGLATVFTVLMISFAPGPILIEETQVSMEEFRLPGLAIAAGAALVSLSMGAVVLGISRRRSWFRAVLMGLAIAVLVGGVVANLIADQAALAAASAVLAIPALGLIWAYLYRNRVIQSCLES